MARSKEEIEAMDAAYKSAGHNAYFGNGFYAGVKFGKDKYINHCKEDENGERCITNHGRALKMIRDYEKKIANQEKILLIIRDEKQKLRNSEDTEKVGAKLDDLIIEGNLENARLMSYIQAKQDILSIFE